MRMRWSIVLAGAFAVAACAERVEEDRAAGEVATVPAPAAADRSALDELRETYVQHFNAGAADGVAGLHTEDSFWLTADGAFHEGRPAIESWLREGSVAAPRLDVTTDDMLVFGDEAVTRGRYTLHTTAPDGSSGSMSGAFLNHLVRTDGGWRVAGTISNFDAQPPEDFAYFSGTNRTPADEGTMQELNDAWLRHYNAGDAAAVAALYTQDAVVAPPNSPFVEGRAAIQAGLEEELETYRGQLVELHDVGTRHLTDGWALDGGWFHWRGSIEGETIDAVGSFLSLLRRGEDGQWRIHWEVSNDRPAPQTEAEAAEAM